jgi:hypothetical protein
MIDKTVIYIMNVESIVSPKTQVISIKENEISYRQFQNIVI